MSKLRIEHIGELAKVTVPDIPVPADIDLSKLKEEEQPKVLRIGKVGAQSRNVVPGLGKPRVYGRAFYDSLVSEINSKRSEGTWGHVLDPKRRAEDYPPPAVRWIGATIDPEGVVWGKVIPLTQESQDHLRVAEATNAQVATSLVGMATFKGNEALSIDLESLDLAHPGRAGIADAVSNVYVSEMVEDGDNEELVAEIANLQSAVETHQARVAELEGQLAEAQTAQTNLGMVRQLIAEQADMFARMELNVSAYGDDFERVIRDMIEKLTMLQGQAFLRGASDTVAEMVALDALRPLIVAQLGLPSAEGVTTVQVAEMFQKHPTLDDLKAKVKALMEQPYVQTIAKSLVAEQAGPAAIVGAAQQQGDLAREQVIKDAESGKLTRDLGLNHR